MSATSPPKQPDETPGAPRAGSIAAVEHRELRLPSGPIRYREVGAGPPVVFVHGLLVDGRLWDGVADELASECRCIVPDWPFGSHQAPLDPDADLSPPGSAAIVADFLEALKLEDVTVVGNDTGGAICQILVTTRPERVGRLVLTNCDTYGHFPPFPFSLMPPVARIPGGMAILAAPFRVGAVRRRIYSLLAREPIDPALVDAWLAPSMRDSAVMRDARKLTAGTHKRHTLLAAERLANFEAPVLFAWGTEDRFFKLAHAQRLAAAIPDARIEEIEGAGTFVSLDRPAAVAGAVSRFLAARSRPA